MRILETAIEPVIGSRKYVVCSRRERYTHGPDYLQRSPLLPSWDAAVRYEAKLRAGHLPPVCDTSKPIGWP
jgi:hypothetical protein